MALIKLLIDYETLTLLASDDSFYITDPKYHSSKSFMIINSKAECSPINKYDIEMDLDDLNQIHQKFKFNFYPNCPFPFTANVSLADHWNFVQKKLIFNFFYVDRSEPLSPFFRNVLDKLDAFVISISNGDYCYGIIKNGKECFVYDPARLYRIG